MDIAQTSRQVKPSRHEVEESDEFYGTRMPSSVRRYHTTPPLHSDVLDEELDASNNYIQRRASRSQKVPSVTAKVPATHATRPHKALSVPTTITKHVQREPQTQELPPTRRWPVVPMLVGMVVMVLLFMSISALLPWWRTYQDDLHYGRPRTSQLDAVVGHRDSAANPTHFIFLNLHGHVEIMEIPGGDATKMRVYMGPVLYGNGADLAPVTGEIRDDNGHENLIVHVQNEELLFVNDGTTFHEH
ncbi:MAG TPA: hypothetical protein VHZ51_28865 [Ktedonobacteraceae bacterium]|nr:hypothetical protein [Ktedonobacteraceae bacterium]